ncbi:hypothetical protein RN001_007204 [Aquatica leii]|uniref:GTP-eEF1A C-terminal domain-containing protein n=1 Tax=Aquatica leii TaxID=1421715 RepID=A0AAN7SNS6_9COLE|nr:hypothetical protein RN001_007204 [Aquatica leii]
MKESPLLPAADSDTSASDGGTKDGTWEDEVEESDALTPKSNKEELSSKEAPKITKKKSNIENYAGESTIGKKIMALTSMVDKKTLEKYERVAREKSWYLLWALDTNQEEKSKGKTVEVGPDLAILVIPTRKGEFATGFDRSGQTRENALLAKTAGVLFGMKKNTTNVNAKDLTLLPCSGLLEQSFKKPIDGKICSWYKDPPFIPFIEELSSLNRKTNEPFIVPIVDKYKDMGTVVMNKVESRERRKEENLMNMPNRTPVTVDQLWLNDDEVSSVVGRENVKLKVKGVEQENVSPVLVLCDTNNPIRIGRVFDAQVVILEHKSIICAGYSAIIDIHCAAKKVTVKALIRLANKKTGKKKLGRSL